MRQSPTDKSTNPHRPRGACVRAPDQALATAGPALNAEFDDVDALCAAVRLWDLDFRPLQRSAPGKRRRVARLVQGQCGPLELGYGRFEASIEQLGAPPPERLTFAVLGTGVRRLWWRGRDVDAATVLVFRPGAELRSLSGPDFEVDTVSIAVETVECFGERFQLPLRSSADGIETFRLGAEALRVVRGRLRMLRQGHRQTSGIARLLLAQQVGEGLALAWLRALTSDRKRGLADSNGRARDRAMRLCLERLEHADWMQLTPSVLCEVGGVGERTLQYAFRERFGLTPAAFLKVRRLTAVRKALERSAGSPTVSVGDLAADFGFWHTGQFAADYRRAFGETPSQTVEQGSRASG
jgi:AraC-like DNA-binding protein